MTLVTSRRIATVLVLLVLVAAAAAAAAVFVLNEEMNRRVELTGEVAFEVQPAESSRRIATRLQEAGLISDARAFRWIAAWKGADRTIKYGRHSFEGTVTIGSILDELARAPKPILRVTIPEGLTLREIAALLENAGAVPAAAYTAVACSQELRRLVDAGPEAACAEGYLFPDSYDLIPGMSAGEIVDLQWKRFREVAGPLLAAAGADSSPPLKSLGREPVSAAVVTLASIIEKETAVGSERPQIAAVFYNRLKTGMPLQTDPTVIYGVIDAGQPWDGNLTRAHLTTATPYNTYMRRGLPPGPICNPGRAAIEAALRPAVTGDLYFVARGDGSHEFNRDLASHNRAVRRFQLR